MDYDGLQQPAEASFEPVIGSIEEAETQSLLDKYVSKLGLVALDLSDQEELSRHLARAERLEAEGDWDQARASRILRMVTDGWSTKEITQTLGVDAEYVYTVVDGFRY